MLRPLLHGPSKQPVDLSWHSALPPFTGQADKAGWSLAVTVTGFDSPWVGTARTF